MSWANAQNGLSPLPDYRWLHIRVNILINDSNTSTTLSLTKKISTKWKPAIDNTFQYVRYNNVLSSPTFYLEAKFYELDLNTPG